MFASCTTKKDASNSPVFVLEQIKKNIEDGDSKLLLTHLCEKDAQKFKTANSVGEIVFGTTGKAIADLLKKKLADSHQLSFENITFNNEKITGNTATVDAYNTKKEKTKIYHFIKENDVWKICKP